MEIVEAIMSRHSVRAFKPDPVPRRILKELLEACLWTPSWANTQPWEFAVVGGQVMAELKRALVEKAVAELSENPDISEPIFTDRYQERRRVIGRRLFALLGIGREDAEKRRQWRLFASRFFGAPNAVILYIDRSLSTWSILDVGMFMQTIMLGALSYGLGTCPMARVIRYPDELRRLLSIPESKLIVCGIAIGYPDMDAPQNSFRSHRDSLETFATWQGFTEDGN